MTQNRPHGRKQNVTGSGTVFRRGEGRGSGPVGNASRPSFSPGRGSSGGGGAPRGPLSLVAVVVVILLAIFGGSGLGSWTTPDTSWNQGYSQGTNGGTIPTSWLFGQSQAADTTQVINDTEPDHSVSPNARQKYVDVANAKTATIFVYMCGADLESQSGMASRDLMEMQQGLAGSNVRVIVQTGGANSWHIRGISSRTVQRWELTSDGLTRLGDAGSVAMTDPSTLRDFVSWGIRNYAGDRNALILWDHGGGSVAGYGYDENFPSASSMSVDQIAGALKGSLGSQKFDFIGFDACLMATLETSVALEPYSDYLIASEETEPGTGWYYTDWLRTLGQDPAVPTVDLGKVILDSYIDNSDGSLTLSLIDLAELQGTVGTPLKDFSARLKSDILSGSARSVADARAGAKEFARQNAIDQIDLVDFANKLGSSEANALSDAVRSAVKYNRTQNISHSYGMSVYFPYRNPSMVSRMCDINTAIAMDDGYTGAIKSFATLGAAAGQVNSQTAPSIFDLLTSDQFSDYSGLSGASGGALPVLDLLMQDDGAGLESLLGGAAGFDRDNLGAIATVLEQDRLSTDALDYTEVNGQRVVALSEDEWQKVHEVNLNVWVDEGSGYIDLGYDNVYDFDDQGNLIADFNGNWIALNGHPVAVYATDSEYGDDGSYRFNSYIPALLNGEEVRILIEYSSEHEDGIVLGAEKVYDSGTEGKGLIQIQAEDTIEPLCDYYDYGGGFQDSYLLGDAFQAGDDLQLSDVTLTNDSYLFGYALKDTWNTTRYTPMVRGD